METTKKSKVPFAVFGRHGYVIIAFASEADAISARQSLLSGGHGEDEIPVYSAAEVKAEIIKRSEHKGILESLGYGFESEALEQHLDLAEQGCTFMVVYAPTHHEEQRVLNVVHRYRVLLVRKYGLFVISDLPTN